MATLPPMMGAQLDPYGGATGPIAPTLGPMGGMGMADGLADPMASLAALAAALPPLPEKEEKPAIDKLADEELHRKVLEKLRAMFRFSQGEMSKHHSRWAWQEQKVQAYVRQPDYKQAMQEYENNTGAPPEPVSVIVPYSYATLHAAATFLASVLLGRRPIFPILPVRGSTADKARYMETAIQANLEASRAYEVLWQFIWDSLNYSFGSVRITWAEEFGKSLRLVGGQRQMVEGLKFAGNQMFSIDPYLFFPDPRVPIQDCSRKGDFVFWEVMQSKLILKDMEKDEVVKYVDKACSNDKYGRGQSAAELPAVADSQRRARIGASGTWTYSPQNVTGFVAVREGTVRLVPKDWGLGDSDRSELWKFAWVNDKQIIQAEPLGMAHERHPVACSEPTSFGYEFGSLSMAEMIGPFQDLISWLVNSRMKNVRSSIHNQFLVDPSRIELADLRKSPEGRVIRLRKAAMGTPIEEAFRQLAVHDVTQGHIGDIQMLRLLADSITGINDNMRGIQTTGGRRSATEARMSMQAGASRLSQMAVRISAQGLSDIAQQMISNIQQFMPDEMWIEMTGDDGQPVSSLLTPDMLVGDFNYQISDGSLPYDKMALLEVWKEIMFGIAADPELRQRYDLGRIFDHVAVLGGAKNIKSFEKQQQMAPQMQPELMGPGQEPPPGAMPIGAANPMAPAALNPMMQPAAPFGRTTA